MVRLAGAELGAETDCDSFLRLAHLFFCAAAILRRDAAETLRVGWFVFGETPILFKDSIQKLLGSTSPLPSALGDASLEALGAHSLNSTSLPPGVF
jgi:hypothetical protein